MEPGIYENVSFRDYAKIPALSASALKAASRSMAHARAYLTGASKSSDALAFGQQYHCYLLEPERFATDYKVCEKIRRAGKAWDDLLDSVGGREDRIVWTEDIAVFSEMRAALLADSRKRAITTAKGRYELTLVWNDPHTGVLVKGRVDKLIDSISTAVDLKTAKDARDREFCRAAAEYGYATQFALYADGLAVLTGKPHDFIALAQESDAPYCSAMYRMTPDCEAAKVGRWQYRNLLAAVTHCKKTGEWPGYGDEVNELILPKWAIPQGMTE